MSNGHTIYRANLINKQQKVLRVDFQKQKKKPEVLSVLSTLHNSAREE